jgi:small subunit ribosomal protein S6
MQNFQLVERAYMIRYETLFITLPEITSSEGSELEKHFEKAVTNEKGTVISLEKWGKYHLAYPIENRDYGVYYLMRFEVAEDRKEKVLNDLKNLFRVKLVDLIMRDITVRLHPKASLEYTRPESLEEAPNTKDIDVIMKESKGYIGSKEKPRGASDEKQKESFELEEEFLESESDE